MGRGWQEYARFGLRKGGSDATSQPQPSAQGKCASRVGPGLTQLAAPAVLSQSPSSGLAGSESDADTDSRPDGGRKCWIFKGSGDGIRIAVDQHSRVPPGAWLPARAGVGGSFRSGRSTFDGQASSTSSPGRTPPARFERAMRTRSSRARRSAESSDDEVAVLGRADDGAGHLPGPP